MAWVDPDETYVPDPHTVTLRVGTPGGDTDAGEFTNAEHALSLRDAMREELERKPERLRVFDVIDSDHTDPPETGELEWCAGCEKVAVLRSRELCEACR